MKTKIAQISIILLLFLASCGDAEIRLNNKIEGNYKLTYFSKNYAEYTDYWNTNYNLTFHFYKPDPDSHVFLLDGSIKKTNTWYNYSYASPYKVYINDDEQFIRFSAALPSFEYDSLYPEMLFYPIIIDSGIPINDYHIIQIDRKEIQLEYSYQNDDYAITLSL
jgi:hypothetical protein